jgi:hypothetical protein
MKAGNVSPQVGCGPLFNAAQGGHDEVVLLLLENRASVNAVNSVLFHRRFEGVDNIPNIEEMCQWQCKADSLQMVFQGRWVVAEESKRAAFGAHTHKESDESRSCRVALIVANLALHYAPYPMASIMYDPTR